jgi:hypothetical protein
MIGNCAFKGFCRVLPETGSQFCPRHKALIDHFGVSRAEEIEFSEANEDDLPDFDDFDDDEDDE